MINYTAAIRACEDGDRGQQEQNMIKYSAAISACEEGGREQQQQQEQQEWLRGLRGLLLEVAAEMGSTVPREQLSEKLEQMSLEELIQMSQEVPLAVQ